MYNFYGNEGLVYSWPWYSLVIPAILSRSLPTIPLCCARGLIEVAVYILCSTTIYRVHQKVQFYAEQKHSRQ